ncbi:MAG TPA: HYR domain-containing protein [Thermoanaerobaculia bacterium]|jgi:hypothetical protein
MRFRSAVLVGILCLLAGSASAEIIRFAPSVVPYASSDSFITIYGTDLLGTEGTLVVFDDLYEVEPSGSSTEISVGVPIDVSAFAGDHTFVVRSFDAAGVRVHGPVTFTVETQPGGGGPPLLSLPEFIVAEADSVEGADVRYVAEAVSASTGDPVTVTCTPAPGFIFPLGTTIVQCSATDAGGTATGGFSVFVTDTTPPVLTVPADIETDNPVVTFTATAVDNIDGSIGVSCAPASGSTFPAGRTRVRCTAVDAHFNLTTEFFFVRVTGGPPQLTVPDDKFVEATSAAGAVVDFADEVIAEEANSVVCAPASGSVFALGTTKVTCTATNAAGSTSGSFNIIVDDHAGPVLNIADVEAEATSPAGANVSYTATATDAVEGPVAIVCDPLSGTFFAFGTTEVLCTASDSRGNVTAGSFNVIVQDTTAPTIVVATASPNSLWPPNHKMVPIALTVSATDAVDPTPSLYIVSVTSNQPINGTGDGDTAPDWQITGPLSLNVRAERAGGSERVYTITVAATDLYGNVSTAQILVRVPDSRKARSVH